MESTLEPVRLPWTGDDEADRLLETDPLALLIGFVLDQQVTLQKAFSGPLELKRRIGTLDAAAIASMDTPELESVFSRRPALHRFPGNMARRTQAMCEAIVRDYGGDAARVWTEAKNGPDLERRLLALPGIGEMKAKTLLAVLGKRFGVRPTGWEDVAPRHPTLGDVDSPEALATYQAGKRVQGKDARCGRGRGQAARLTFSPESEARVTSLPDRPHGRVARRSRMSHHEKGMKDKTGTDMKTDAGKDKGASKGGGSKSTPKK